MQIAMDHEFGQEGKSVVVRVGKTFGFLEKGI